MSTKKDGEQRNQFVLDLIRLQGRAMELGLIRTSHKIHDATREVGWEMADILQKEQADLDLRPKDTKL